MSTITVSHYDYETGVARRISNAEYRRRYREAMREFGDLKTRVDDGEGGTAWKFFSSVDDLLIWRNQT